MEIRKASRMLKGEKIMKKKNMKKIGGLLSATLMMGLTAGLASYPALATNAEENEKTTVVATQTSGAGVIDVSNYAVSINVNEDYTVDVAETVTVKFVDEQANSFYRYIPHSADVLSSVSVACEENADFYYVLVEEFNSVKIECFGGISVDNEWTYEIGYTVALDAESINEQFVFNIINDGWQNTVENIVAKITLPDYIVNYDVCNGVGDKANGVSAKLSDDGKTVTIKANNTQAVVASTTDALMVKIYLPDAELIEDYNKTMEVAEQWIWPPLLTWVLGFLCMIIFGILLVVF